MSGPKDLVSRVAVLLRAVASQEPRGVTTTEVAGAVDLARPTVHRLLTSLAEQALLERAPNGRWLLGPELYLLGTVAQPRYDVTTMAQPFVRRLASETGESAFFSVRRGDESVCLVREDGSFPLRSHVLYEGARFPLGVASAGLVILAFLSERDSDDYLRRADLRAFGADHAVDVLRRRLTQTRRAGFATNPGLIVEGSWGMAAAVFDASSAPIGALSITGVEHRFAEARRPELGRLLLKSAHELSLRVQAWVASGSRQRVSAEVTPVSAHEARPVGSDDELGAVSDLELAHRPTDVGLHGQR